MSHVCRDDMGSFDRLLRLPPDHPERAEVEACPRCGARFLEFQMFLQGADVEGADPAGAERVLSERVRVLASAQADGWWTRVRRSFSSPKMLVPALVAMAVIAIGVWRWQPWVDRSLEVRSTEVSSPGVVIESTRTNPDGSVEVAWRAFPSADAYAVRVLRADLTEIRRIGPVTATTARIDDAGLPSGTKFYCQVVALQGGDRIASSPIRKLPRPSR